MVQLVDSLRRSRSRRRPPVAQGLRAELEPVLALLLGAWTIVVVARAPTAGGIEEARRYIRRALA